MANLINSIKAFGEKVTGEKIEGITLIDSMKDMGKKMTGKEIEGNSLLAIIDETTEGYEGGGSGGGSYEIRAVNLSYGHRAVINWQPLIDYLEANGINTSLTLNELHDALGHPITILMGTSNDATSYTDHTDPCTFIVDLGNGDDLKFNGNWYMLPSFMPKSGDVTLRECILNLSTEAKGASSLETLYVMPWFDIKNVD